MDDNAQNVHSPFGGSSLWRRKECPGSYNEEAGLPDPPPSEAAEMGTRVHGEVASTLLQFMEDQSAPRLVSGHDEQEIEFAEDCANFFLSLWEKHAGKPGAYFFIEQMVHFHETPGDKSSPLLTWGTTDAGIVVPSERLAEICDWKFGYKDFSQGAVGWQVMHYGQSVMEELGLENVSCRIRNPRLGKSYECSFGINDGARGMVEGVIEEARTSTALRAGDWCDYCKARGVCSATVDQAKALVTAIDVPKQKNDTETKKAMKAELEGLPIDKLLPLLNMASQIKPAYEAVLSHARARLREDPECLPGWRLTRRGGARSAPIGDAFHALSGLMEPSEYWECCTASVRKLEEVVEKKYAEQDRKKVEGKAAFKSAMKGLISQSKVEELRRVKSD